MYRYEDIVPGATANCPDGQLGTVARLMHDSVHGYVTGLVVAGIEPCDEVVVPISLVDKVDTPKRVSLGCTLAEALAYCQPKDRTAGEGI